MSQNLNSAVAVIGIDIGKNLSAWSTWMIDIVLRPKWLRGQIESQSEAEGIVTTLD